MADFEALKKRISEDSGLIERELEKAYSFNNELYGVLYDGMKYGILDAGKRVRPFLALEFCRLFGGKDENVLPFALAIESIHNYSLVHDDMPCMDNDDLRRGKATVHKKFGEANALLVGDALLTYAFEIASSENTLAPEYVIKAINLLARCAGPDGMIGGQQIDLLSENKKIDFETLRILQEKKTGCLIRCASLLGVIACGEECDSLVYEDVNRYAQCIGFCFQIVDDILDVIGDEEMFGKPIGSDSELNKTTILSFCDIDSAYRLAKELTDEAKSAISKYEGSELLCDFADYLYSRKK